MARRSNLVFTGIRPGEKLFEELFVQGEIYNRTQHTKIFVAGNASTAVPAGLDEGLGVLTAAAQRGDRAAILRGLQALVPEYVPGGAPAAAFAPRYAPAGPRPTPPGA